MAPVGSVFARPFTAIFAAAFLFGAAPVLADDLPSPKIDCSKPGNKKKPACKPHRSSDDAVINGAYWLSHTDKHAEALALLGTVVNQENPRFLNAMGYTTRKLGNVDGALPYYARALEIEPDYVQVREYMGEAFLAKGDLAHANEQLGEITRRCGTGCVSFSNLKKEISAFKAAHPENG